MLTENFTPPKCENLQQKEHFFMFNPKLLHLAEFNAPALLIKQISGMEFEITEQFPQSTGPLSQSTGPKVDWSLIQLILIGKSPPFVI